MKEELCRLASQYAGKETTTVPLEMPVELFEQVKEAAALEESDYQALINCYVHHGLANDQVQIKRKQFAEHVRDVLEKHGIHKDAISEISTKILY